MAFEVPSYRFAENILDQFRNRKLPSENMMKAMRKPERPLLAADAKRRVIYTPAPHGHVPPAYAHEGACHTPVPVFRWQLGQHIDQALSDLQYPLLERIMNQTPERFTVLEAESTAYIHTTAYQLPEIPSDADIICYGVWTDPFAAAGHRVFMMDRRNPAHLDFAIEHADAETLRQYVSTHIPLMDTGLHLFTEEAHKAMAHCSIDTLKQRFKVAVVPLTKATYYSFATTEEMVRSTMNLQNIVQDQRLILQSNLPKHPSLFTQNAIIDRPLTAENGNIWIENAHIARNWSLSHDNVITGVPENDWGITFKAGQCISVLPVGAEGYAVCLYDFATPYTATDLPAYHLCPDATQLGKVLKALIAGCPTEAQTIEGCKLEVNTERLTEQRLKFMKACLQKISGNYTKSIFYQLDLHDMVQKYHSLGLEMPKAIAEDASQTTRIRDAMFRAQLLRASGQDGSHEEQKAFSLLCEGLVEAAYNDLQQPHLAVYPDQIVWGRSAVRIDIAGGWTDTPPFCVNTGGNVVNLAIELNGQQPLQVYVKPCKEPHIVCKSIDLSAQETIDTYEELALFNKVGSPFSIPKAALALCGFLPQFAQHPSPTLREQLEEFGCGIEITLLSAIPAGSGLGTSSILAATVLGALSDFCGLGWDKMTICDRTLLLEQLLTTGGGWQDQYGGVLHGVKLLQSGRGFVQTPTTRWLPDTLWTDPENRACHLLYYTGITRTAKQILAEIVRGMFLNSAAHLDILNGMKEHALQMYEAIQRGNMAEYGRLVRRTWSQNKALDSGTEPPLVAQLCQRIDDLCSGYKLPGAGGGGYLYMVAKDPEAAARIKHILTADPLTASARFVEMKLSRKGLQVSRS